MALEIFGLLTADGDLAQTDHIFTGRPADVAWVGSVLGEIYATNKRLRSVSALAARFQDGAALSVPFARLTKAECRLLVDTLDKYVSGKPKKTKARKLLDLMSTALAVY